MNEERRIPIEITVTNCARCGGTHHDVTERVLDQPIAPNDADGIVWDRWFPCPANGQPVLIRAVSSR